MIELDGSHLEGGGQILRTAVGMSAFTQQSCRVFNIRAGRSKPGLMPQHLKSIEAVAALCDAKTEGLGLGSGEIIFQPSNIRTQDITFDVGTAGSLLLILQALLIPATRIDHSIKIELTGGTHVLWSPTYEYFKYVFCPILETMGFHITSEISRYGFYPRGGGNITVRIDPVKELIAYNPIRAENDLYIKAWSCASENLTQAKVAERQMAGAGELLKIDQEDVCYTNSYSTGSALTLAAVYEGGVLGSDSLGKRGLPAEEVGHNAAYKQLQTIKSNATVDEFMSDQILPYLAMARGESKFNTHKLTRHAQTNMWVIEKFLDTKFKVHKEDNTTLIWCSGLCTVTV